MPWYFAILFGILCVAAILAGMVVVIAMATVRASERVGKELKDEFHKEH